jgi:parvulin-like peptidyl-prolyl isomerase
LLLLAALACSSPREPAPAVPPPAATATAEGAPADFLLPYPRARWRLVSRDRLYNVVLWVSHILVRHTDARNSVVSFSVGDWTSVLPPPTRSRAEALALAKQLAGQLESDPGRFAELARTYSEDLNTRDQGGYLGGVAAIDLEFWPQVLDALATIRPGQISQVVETHYGFHVLLRHPPPPQRTLSGSHIVIGHDHASWLETAARGPLLQRTREDAEALANRIYETVSADPSRFAELVERQSEHADAVLGGDFGGWSTHDSTAFRNRLIRLSELEEGAVARPIETQLGFEIIQHTAPRPRQTFSADAIVLRFDPEVPAMDRAGRQTVLERASEAAKRLASEPEAFEAVARALGTTVESLPPWLEGRGDPLLTAQLRGLTPGAVLGVPSEGFMRFFIVRRTASAPVVPDAIELELPTPAAADVPHHVGYMPPAAARRLLQTAASEAATELALAPASAQRLIALHEPGAGFDDSASLDERWSAYRSIQQQTRALLGEAQFERYQHILEQACEAALLRGPLDRRYIEGL